MHPTIVQKGIDLQNRLWDSAFKKKFSAVFVAWQGRSANRITFVCLFIILAINLFAISAFLKKDVSLAYQSQSILYLAYIVGAVTKLSSQQFFSLLTLFALNIAPVSFYLFARKISNRDDAIAFLAGLIFVLPNPFLGNSTSLSLGILLGDGGHMLVFSFMPLLALYIHSFIRTGVPFWGVLSAFITTFIVIISPFAFFNLLLLIGVLTISEGFLGSFRIKIARLAFIVISSVGLSLFWYYPNIVSQPLLLKSVHFAAKAFWDHFPLMFVIVPVFGTLSFLIFDRRQTIQPIFISLTLSFVYIFLYIIGQAIKVEGIFTAQRYIPELSMYVSLFIAICVIFLFRFFEKRLVSYILQSSRYIFFTIVFLFSIFAALVIFMSFVALQDAHQYIVTKSIIGHASSGVSTLSRFILSWNVYSLIANFASVVTLVLLLFIFKKFPSKVKNA